jgi:hypothetical protein
MRSPALLVLAVVLVSWYGPTRAQTFDLNYPFCMRVSEWGGSRVECSYTSLAQCTASASGLAATCVANPYYSLGRRDRRY